MDLWFDLKEREKERERGKFKVRTTAVDRTTVLYDSTKYLKVGGFMQWRTLSLVNVYVQWRTSCSRVGFFGNLRWCFFSSGGHSIGGLSTDTATLFYFIVVIM